MRDLPLADPGTPDLRTGRRMLFWFVRAQAGVLAGGACYGIVWMAAQAAVPAVLGRAIDDGIAARDTTRLMTWAAVLLGLGVIQGVSGAIRHRFAVTSFALSQARVHQLMSRHLTHLGVDATRRLSAGDVAAVAGGDAHGVAHTLDVIPRLTGAVVSIIAVTAILFTQSPILGAVVLAGVPVVAAGFGVIARPLAAREDERRTRLGEATALASDTVTGLRVLRGFGGEHAFVERFVGASQSVRRAASNTARLHATLEALQIALPGLFLVVVTWVGARLVAAGDITVGTLVACYAYTAFLVVPLRTFAEAARKYAAAVVAADRIAALLRVQRSLTDPTDPVPPPDPLTAELHDQKSGLRVPPGSFTAVAAAEPEDATAVVDRLGRYSPTAATMGGIPLEAMALADLRAAVVVSDKDPVLLSGALAETLDPPRRGRDLGIDAVLEAASAADVVDAVADGFDGELPERGRSLSGGQRQRLALARVLRADPPVLVLDEPTSAIDAHTEARVAAGIRTLRAGRTTVVTTTSPLVLDRADHVALLVGGRVVATGTHRELLRDSPTYRDLVLRGEDE